MKPAIDRTISQEAPPTLQSKRSLLPIDEYAAREGLSRETIEECGRLGIIQIRKYKGKTFVVDVPLSPYLRTTETAAAPPQAVSKSTPAQKTPKPTQKVTPDVPETVETNEPVEPGAISRLVEKMFETASKITDKPEETAPAPTLGNDNQAGCSPRPSERRGKHPHARKAGAEPGIINRPAQIRKEIQTPHIENPPEVIQTPELETFNGPAETLEIINESTETKETPRPAPALQNDKSHPDAPAAQAEPRRVLPAATILLSVIFLAAVFGNLWLYMDRQIQLDRLNQAHAGIQQAHSDLAQTNQRSETLQNELNNYKAELIRTQNELGSSKAEVKRIQDELARTTQTLSAAQQRNSEAVERLNEQIRRLTTQLTELTEPPPAPPGSIQN